MPQWSWERWRRRSTSYRWHHWTIGEFCRRETGCGGGCHWLLLFSFQFFFRFFFFFFFFTFVLAQFCLFRVDHGVHGIPPQIQGVLLFWSSVSDPRREEPRNGLTQRSGIDLTQWITFPLATWSVACWNTPVLTPATSLPSAQSILFSHSLSYTSKSLPKEFTGPVWIIVPLWDNHPSSANFQWTCSTARATNSPFAPPCDLHRKQGHTTQQHMHRTDPALHRFDVWKSWCARKIHNFMLGFKKRCCHRCVSSKLQRMSSLAIHRIAPGHFAPGPKNSQEFSRIFSETKLCWTIRSNTQSSGKVIGQGRPPRAYCRTSGFSIKLHRAWLWVTAACCGTGGSCTSSHVWNPEIRSDSVLSHRNLPYNEAYILGSWNLQSPWPFSDASAVVVHKCRKHPSHSSDGRLQHHPCPFRKRCVGGYSIHPTWPKMEHFSVVDI